MQSPIKKKKRNEAASINIEGIRKAIFDLVTASASRLSPPYLEKTVSETYGLDKPFARAVIKDLVAEGQLEYTYEFGSTYLAPSFNKPVRISTRVVVMPPGCRYRPGPDDVIIQIKPGGAFGSGRHPTTRLSINAIEFFLNEVRQNGLRKKRALLDIGTGSGILAIAALCLGVEQGLAIDMDPCALAEATENRALNHLEGRLTVSNRRLDRIHSSFSMVIANLRYPSLKSFYPLITELTDTGGGVVLSGFRPHERGDLMKLYTRKHFEVIWSADELDWVATVLKRDKSNNKRPADDSCRPFIRYANIF